LLLLARFNNFSLRNAETFADFQNKTVAQNPKKKNPGLPLLTPGKKNAPLPAFLRQQENALLLAVKLQPRASRNEIEGPLGAELRIKVTAPPVDAAANEALLRLLADMLDCPRNRIQLIRGQTSRHKTVALHGMTSAEVMGRLKQVGTFSEPG
jgi:uncharacterized protein (TIGR00251 family)